MYLGISMADEAFEDSSVDDTSILVAEMTRPLANCISMVSLLVVFDGTSY